MDSALRCAIFFFSDKNPFPCNPSRDETVFLATILRRTPMIVFFTLSQWRKGVLGRDGLCSPLRADAAFGVDDELGLEGEAEAE